MIRTTKRIYLSSKMKCTLWHKNERHDIKARKGNTYFKQVVRSCVSDIKKGYVGYCFSYEQLQVIKEKLQGVIDIKQEYCEEDGVYYVERLYGLWKH